MRLSIAHALLFLAQWIFSCSKSWPRGMQVSIFHFNVKLERVKFQTFQNEKCIHKWQFNCLRVPLSLVPNHAKSHIFRSTRPETWSDLELFYSSENSTKSALLFVRTLLTSTDRKINWLTSHRGENSNIKKFHFWKNWNFCGFTEWIVINHGSVIA